MPRPQHTARSGGVAILPARSTGNLHNSRHKPRRAGKGDARAGTALHPGGTLGGAKLARSAARVTIVVFLSRLGSSVAGPVSGLSLVFGAAKRHQAAPR